MSDIRSLENQIRQLQKNRDQVHKFGKAWFDVEVFNEKLDRITSEL